MTDISEIKHRLEELKKKQKELKKQQDHLRLEFEHLYLDCPHPNKYSTNAWGRDPGGAYCPDCGKDW